MKGIIEKLGITPGPWKGLHGGGIDKRCNKHIVSTNPLYGQICILYKTINDTANSLLIASAPEMLEALIRRVQTDYIYVQCGEIDFRDIESDVNIIEKATGKSWEEIKELLNEKVD